MGLKFAQTEKCTSALSLPDFRVVDYQYSGAVMVSGMCNAEYNLEYALVCSSF
jgi:hypothetical protein